MLRPTIVSLEGVLKAPSPKTRWGALPPKRSVEASTVSAQPWLDLYLDSIRDDGSAERLYEKWFVEPVGEVGG